MLYVEHNAVLELPPAALLRTFHEPLFLVGNWAPVHVSFLYLENALFGRHPLGYRIANVVLLAACAAALRALAGRAGASPGGALLAATLFVAHPASVEAVAWISQSKTLLALLFALLALERWLAHLETPAASRLAAALALAALALLAKSAVVLLPVVFAVGWYTHARRVGPDVWAVALTMAFAAYVALVNVKAQGAQGGIATWFGGSPEATARILPAVIWRYLRMALLPYDPVFCVQPETVDSWLDGRVWLPLLGIAAALALAGFAVARDRRFGLAVAWVGASLLPVVQVVPMTTVYADRYLTMALPALLVLVAEPVARLRLWQERPGAGRLAASLVVLLLAGRSAWQARLWAQPEALFLQSVAAYPSSRHGWTGLGGERHQQGRLEEAAEAYQRALAIEPHDGWVHALLARVRLQQGEEPRALFHLEAALRDGPQHPDAAWMRTQVDRLRGQGVVPDGAP